MSGAQWEITDSDAPNVDRPASKGSISGNGNKENLHNGSSGNAIKQVGIKSNGDGMGGKKGTGRSWGFGDESDEDGVGKNGGKFHASKIQQKPKDSAFWDEMR